MDHRRAFRSLAADASRVPLIVALLAVITAVACAVEDSGGCVGGCVLPAVGEGGCMRVRTSASLSACRGRSSAPPSPTATRPTPRRRQTAPEPSLNLPAGAAIVYCFPPLIYGRARGASTPQAVYGLIPLGAFLGVLGTYVTLRG